MVEPNKTKSLETALFSAADALRSKMDANEYKNYGQVQNVGVN